ncbi:MAG: DUF1838 domain-containing protein [Gemmatimonadaceae bacterium]|nr:DUF1838 domain-containing protein [Gloeobacterales cyanobacterium ES-bin-141]
MQVPPPFNLSKDTSNSYCRPSWAQLFAGAVRVVAVPLLLTGTLLAAGGTLTHAQQSPRTESFGAKDFARVRCSLDSQDTFFTWSGSIYSFVPGEAQRRLFTLEAMSVARCLPNPDGSWTLTSRELSYYLDPSSGRPLFTWRNPWTEEVVPVVHVANSPVQNTLTGSFVATATGRDWSFPVDVPLTYPNPLSVDPRYIPYSSGPLYQAGEFFKFFVNQQELQDSSSGLAQVDLGWVRSGPWLPWMKMGTRPGSLVYTAQGSKVQSFEDLPELLKEEINARLPLYRSAPLCRLAAPNATSWNYFIRYFDAYLRAERFPIPAADDPQEICAG